MGRVSLHPSDQQWQRLRRSLSTTTGATPADRERSNARDTHRLSILIHYTRADGVSKQHQPRQVPGEQKPKLPRHMQMPSRARKFQTLVQPRRKPWRSQLLWLDLTAAGVAGNTNYTLTVVLPDMAPVRPCRLSSLLLRQLLNERGSD